MTVAVLGAGAYGTALAVSLAQNGPVTLWSRDADQAEAMRRTRRNPTRLSDVALPDNVHPTADIKDLADISTLLLAVPAQQIARLVRDQASSLTGRSLVNCAKGIDLETGLGPSALIRSILPGAPTAVLTGPSFAEDIARGLPTALTLASADDDLAVELQHEIATPNLRIYRSNDPLGAELGGALKNVIAIACGAVMGVGLGLSARAAVMTRGFAEMSRAAVELGAQPATLQGLSGLGDLALTCTSDLSRNYRFGFALGKGDDFDQTLTVEGAATSRALRKVAQRSDLSLPICLTVADLVDEILTVSEAIEKLMARPLRSE